MSPSYAFPWMRRLARVTVAAALVLSTGCTAAHRTAATGTGAALGAGQLAQAEQVVAAAGRYSVRGLVDWPRSPDAPYQLAAINANAQTQNATVAMMELGSGITVGTGWTDNSGDFTISTGGYVPQVGGYYVIEGIKGLGAQLPGNQATRLRTISQWTGTYWKSITNAASGGQISLDQLTTALALEVGLGNIPASDVISTVDPAISPPQLTSTAQTNGVGGHSAAEINQLATDVKNYILASLDPVEQVDAVTPTLFTISPVEGAAGQVVVLNGTGFVSGATTVDFTAVGGGGDPATILAMTPTEIYAQVPNGSISGDVWVVTSRGMSGNAPFAITNGAIVTISTITPDPVSLGNTITILGSNFVTPAGGNNVTFEVAGGGTAMVAANTGDSASLAVTIPQNAISGLVHVSNSVGTSNNFFLSVSDTGIPTINSVFPTKGVAEQDVLLNGILFGNTQGTVTVTDTAGNAYSAQIRYWRDNQVRFTVPWQVVGQPGGSPVQITLYNAAQQAATHTWTALAGQVQYGSWIAGPTLNSNGGIETIPFWSGSEPNDTSNLYILGGGGSNNIADLSLNSDGGPGTLTQSVGTMPITTSSPDGHGHYDTWLGDRYWVFDNDGSPQKCYLQFDPQGNFVTAVNVSPSFELLNGVPFYQHDTAICGGPHGIYMSGSDDSGSPTFNNLIYSLFDPGSDAIGPWQSVPLPGDEGNSNAICYQDASCLVLQNNLWRFGGYYPSASASEMVAPLNADGSPVYSGGSSPFYVAGPTPMGGANSFMGQTVPIGPYLYNFNPYWCCGGSTAYYSPLISGTYAADYDTTWASGAENLTLPNVPQEEVVGGWVYEVGGYSGSTNVIYYAPIQ